MADIDGSSQPPDGMEDFVNQAPPANAVDSSGPNSPPPGLVDFVKPELESAKYGTPAQMALTALEGAGRGGTFGLLNRGESKIGQALNIPELQMPAQEARQRENPISNVVGMGGGFAGLEAATGGFGGIGEVGALGRAGAAASEAATAAVEAGSTAAEVAQAARAAKLASMAGETLFSRIGAQAAKGAIDAAIFSSGDQTAKAVFNDDPNQTVGSALVNVGLNAALGGVLGGALGGAGELWNAKVGSKLSPSIDAAKDSLYGDSAADTGVLQDLPESQTDVLSQNFGVLKPNAPEIANAWSDIASDTGKDVKIPTGSLESSPTPGNIAETLAKGPTVAGQVFQRERQAADEALTDYAKKALRDQTSLSEFEAGKSIREGVEKSIKDEYAPIKASYEELKPIFKEIPVTVEQKGQAAASILENDLIRPGSPLEKQANSIIEDINGLRNVNDLKNYRTELSNDLSKAFRAGDQNSISILQSAKNALNDIRQSAIVDGVQDGTVLNKIIETDAQYAALKAKLKRLGVESSSGTINNVSSMLERFGKIPEENFTGKLFNPSDVEGMRWFNQNFPKQFDLARRSYLRDIAEKSVDYSMGKNGKFSIGKFMGQIKPTQLGPEATDMLFPGQAPRLQNLKTAFQAFPGIFNTSNTTPAAAIARIFSIEGMADNLSAGATYALLKGAPHLDAIVKGLGGDKAAQMATLKLVQSEPGLASNPSALKTASEYISNVLKGQNTLGKAIRGLFSGTQAILPSQLIPSDKDREKLDKKLKQTQASIEPLINAPGELGHYMPEHSAALTQTLSSAATYLNSLRPAPQKAAPLDPEPEISPVAKRNYENALTIAEQPLTVLQKVKDGSIEPTDIVHLQKLYPDFYQQLRDRVTHAVIDASGDGKAVPYQLKMSLSMFLGQPLDSSMSPQAIVAAQSISMPAQAQQQPPAMMQRGPHSMKNIGKMANMESTPGQAREMSRGSRV